MRNGDLEIGDIVRLSEDHRWDRSPANPLDSLGRVIQKNPNFLHVLWEKPFLTNVYLTVDSDLILVESC